MRLNQMSGRQSRTERKLASKNSGGDYASELSCIIARIRGVRASDAKEVEHSALWLEDGAATDGADFDAGHADGDLEGTV